MGGLAEGQSHFVSPGEDWKFIVMLTLLPAAVLREFGGSGKTVVGCRSEQSHELAQACIIQARRERLWNELLIIARRLVCFSKRETRT